MAAWRYMGIARAFLVSEEAAAALLGFVVFAGEAILAVAVIVLILILLYELLKAADPILYWTPSWGQKPAQSNAQQRAVEVAFRNVVNRPGGLVRTLDAVYNQRAA